MQPVLDEYLHDYPEIPILLRGDSGFSTPDLYKQCEENGTSYVDYAVIYGEFMYKAKSWPYERRVVCKG